MFLAYPATPHPAERLLLASLLLAGLRLSKNAKSRRKSSASPPFCGCKSTTFSLSHKHFFYVFFIKYLISLHINDINFTGYYKTNQKHRVKHLLLQKIANETGINSRSRCQKRHLNNVIETKNNGCGRCRIHYFFCLNYVVEVTFLAS